MPAPALVTHGVHTEVTSYHAHVSRTSTSIYIYHTRDGRRATELAILKEVWVNGETRAVGWPVKFADIFGLLTVPFPDWKHWDAFRLDQSTTDKGRLALRCTMAAIRRGLILGWRDPVEVTDEPRQVKGIDLVVTVRGRRRTVQVKCDYRAGETGNLFLQYAECNPDKAH